MVGIGIGTALDSGTNNFGQSRIINPRSPFSGNSEAANVRLGCGWHRDRYCRFGAAGAEP